jgi:hypothetical protein
MLSFKSLRIYRSPTQDAFEVGFSSTNTFRKVKHIGAISKLMLEHARVELHTVDTVWCEEDNAGIVLHRKRGWHRGGLERDVHVQGSFAICGRLEEAHAFR